MSLPPFSAALAEFLAERHLCTLVTQRADSSPHAVPVGFTFAAGTVRVITSSASVKARNARRGGRAAVTQIDGARWVTLEGPVRVVDDAVVVEAAVAAYARRYRQPRERDDRVVIEIEVDRMMCNSRLR
ncbi:MAG: TIGR03618 family F420-dependent PPOX class oxidoreductase [Actinomycetota bacterium]|nr:TIGR03618 family F420-dependent PPOX class oxidoreductase [Actinomycetota bacterium]